MGKRRMLEEDTSNDTVARNVSFATHVKLDE